MNSREKIVGLYISYIQPFIACHIRYVAKNCDEIVCTTRTTIYLHVIIAFYVYCMFFFFFLKEFQPITSTFNDNSLSSNQDTNQFLI